jgi:hypothetical protein
MRDHRVGISIVLENVDRGVILADVVFVCERPCLILGGDNKWRDNLLLPKFIKLLQLDPSRIAALLWLI